MPFAGAEGAGAGACRRLPVGAFGAYGRLFFGAHRMAPASLAPISCWSGASRHRP